jgi:hypothetical protein
MDGNRIDRATVTELTAASIEAKIQRVRAAAADVGRPTPRLQFSCYHVRVTDAPERSVQRSSWAADVEAEMELLKHSPANARRHSGGVRAATARVARTIRDHLLEPWVGR